MDMPPEYSETTSFPGSVISGNPQRRFSSAERSRSSGVKAFSCERYVPAISNWNGIPIVNFGEMLTPILLALLLLSESSRLERVFLS